MDRASGNVHHRGQALVAVKGDGTALKWIEECFDRDVVAVNGAALRWAALDRTNRDIVFKAVRRNWRALQFAAECCTSDPEIVKAAVSQDLRAIQWTSVPEVVLAAVAQHWQPSMSAVWRHKPPANILTALFGYVALHILVETHFRYEGRP
eukprot:2119254-Amphidinium_carterae.1